MKRKSLYIILALSISCTMLSACKKNDSVEPIETVVEESTVGVETTTAESETTTVEVNEETTEVETKDTAETPVEEEVLTGEEISLDLDEPSEEEIPEGLRYTNTEISPLAGTTSKHGYVFHDDYIQGGPKDEDAIADIEMMFDKGYITEEEYQELLDIWKNPIQESTGGTTGGSTVPGNGGVTVTIEEGPEIVPDGHLSY